MFQEWFWAATASIIDEAKPLGFARELARHKARWRRNAQAWRPHLESSHRCILRAAREASDRDLAVVAGSGWCLDVPLAELSRMFKKVLLVDAAHPRQVRRTAARLGNVELLGADLTGYLGAVVRSLSTGMRLTSRPTPPESLSGLRPGLTVSANTLSQLPLIPLERLWTSGQCSDEQLQAFARSVIEGHLAWLDSLEGVRCLLADHAWLGIAAEETLASDPLHGIRPPEPSERWEWRYAPKPEAHPSRDVVHVVGCSIF